MTIGVQDIAIALPQGVVECNDALAARHEFNADFIREKLGIETRRKLGPDETVSGMAVDAAQQVLAANGVNAAEVGLILVVTQTPDYCLPHTGALVQSALGAPHSAASFDVGLGCSGYVYGLSIARALMTAEDIGCGLLITADAYSRLVDPADRATAPLFGDAATATLLGSDPCYAIGRATFNTDGARSGALIAPGTGSRLERRSPLHMDGRAIFTFMMKEVPKDVAACLARNDAALDQVDCFVFHQASRYLLQSLTRQMKLEPQKVVIDMADVGNTTSSTIPIALKRQVLAAQSGPDRVLISGFGVGLSWSSNLLTKLR